MGTWYLKVDTLNPPNKKQLGNIIKQIKAGQFEGEIKEELESE